MKHSLGLKIMGVAWPVEVAILILALIVLAFWQPTRIASLVPALPYTVSLIGGQTAIRGLMPRIKQKQNGNGV